MNRIYRSLLILFIIVICFQSYFLLQEKSNKNKFTTLPTEIPVSVESPTLLSEEGFISGQVKKIGIPFEFKNFFKEEISFGDTTTFVNPKDGNTVIQFRILDDVAHRARNDAYEIYLNKKKIGEVNGQGMSMVGFSPDGKYFGLRSRVTAGCAGRCQDFIVYVIDLAKGKVLKIYPPRKDFVSVNDSRIEYMPYIESYIWNEEDMINLNFSFIALVFNEEEGFYRISPKEVWRFDLENDQFIFVKQLLN